MSLKRQASEELMRGGHAAPAPLAGTAVPDSKAARRRFAWTSPDLAASLPTLPDLSADEPTWTAKRRRMTGSTTPTASSSGGRGAFDGPCSVLAGLLAVAQDGALPSTERSMGLHHIEALVSRSAEGDGDEGLGDPEADPPPPALEAQGGNPVARRLLAMVLDALCPLVGEGEDGVRCHACSVLLALAPLCGGDADLASRLLRMAGQLLQRAECHHRLHALALQIVAALHSEAVAAGIPGIETGKEVLGLIRRGMAHIDCRVRTAGLRALIALARAGQAVPSALLPAIQVALKDDFESVRTEALTALWLLGDAHGDRLAPQQRRDAGKGRPKRLVDTVFATLCDAVNDLSFSVRVLAFGLLGRLKGVDAEHLLQTFDKKVMSHLRKKRTEHEQLKAKAGRTVEPKPQGDLDVQDMKLMNSGACGAFVHGLEDERYEVRLSAIGAITVLGRHSATFANRAVDFLVDMFNDEIDKVRVAAISSLQFIGRHTVYHEEQLDIMLGVLDDASSELRAGMHRLLAASSVANATCLHAVIYALLLSIQKYPADVPSINACLRGLGRNHDKYAEFLVHDLLKLDGHFAQVEPVLGFPTYDGVLVFLANAALRNPSILTLFPRYVQDHCRVLHDQFPLLIPFLDFSKLDEPLSEMCADHHPRLGSLDSTSESGAGLLRATLGMLRAALGKPAVEATVELGLCRRNLSAVEKYHSSLAMTARFYKDLAAWHLAQAQPGRSGLGPSAYYLRFLYCGQSPTLDEQLADMRCQEHIRALLHDLGVPQGGGNPGSESAAAGLGLSLTALQARCRRSLSVPHQRLARGLERHVATAARPGSPTFDRPALSRVLREAAEVFTGEAAVVAGTVQRARATLEAAVVGSSAHLVAGLPFEVKVTATIRHTAPDAFRFLVSFAGGASQAVKPPATAFQQRPLEAAAAAEWEDVPEGSGPVLVDMTLVLCHPALSGACDVHISPAVAFPLDVAGDPILAARGRVRPHPTDSGAGLICLAAPAVISVTPQRLRKDAL